MTAHRGAGAQVPRGTLRLQLHEGYTLDDAAENLGYFARLGVSHLYLSPITEARAGSTHGYDVVDHQRVAPALGGETALRRLAAGLREAGMGILLDIVPNHMAADPQNPWWRDVLANGRSSRWAGWFDIDWEAPGMAGKLLAPFLEKPYGEALACGDIRLSHETGQGFHLAVHGVAWPLAPASLSPGEPASVLRAHDPAQPSGRARLHALLERQHYRLAWWRCAAEIINWRRFFEISGLVGVRVENDEVFDAVHALALRLYAEGVIDGLRVDHVDGLAEPLSYCRRLRAAMATAGQGRPAGTVGAAPWIVVEKILAAGESLDDRWEVSGTTGYDFAADVGALLHDAAGEPCLFAGWAEVAADDRRPAAWVLDARRRLLERHFAAEREALLDVLARTAGHDPATRDWTRPAVGRALDTLLHHFPVYRTYVEGGPRVAGDQRWFDHALRGAEAVAREDDGVHGSLLGLLDGWLGGVEPRTVAAREAVRRFQQLTPPLAAKSLEDTVFYRYGCLLSRNEVGSDPEVFALDVNAFHQSNLSRAALAPRGLLATATHDHKRGEDVRARLAVLSEIPEEWMHACRAWLRADAQYMPDAGPALSFRYMLLQTLVGAWPPELSAADPAGVERYFERLGEWAVKALREGKQGSGWFAPDTVREEACLEYLRRMAPGQPAHAVLVQVEAFVRRLEPAAIANGLLQVALRMTSPGVPDLYQGTEFRDFSLVDPDNRRPVDYGRRAEALRSAEQVDGMEGVGPVFEPARWPAAAWSDGRVKQALIAALLSLRHDHADAFSSAYRPIPVEGGGDGGLLAFSRGDDVVVVAGVKCASKLQSGSDGMPTLPADHWAGASVSLPAAPAEWRDVLRGRLLYAPAPRVRIADLLTGFPLSVLCREAG